MAYENNRNYEEKRNTESFFSKKIKAGKRRTYFFDVRETRSSDYFITITESKKRFNDDGYDRHKMFIYKEDFNKFLGALTETINYVKTDLMPNFDFDAFNHDQDAEGNDYQNNYSNNSEVEKTESFTASVSETTTNLTEDTDTSVDSWNS